MTVDRSATPIRNLIANGDRRSKKYSILMSATRLYGESRNSASSAGVMRKKIAQTKNASSRYFSERSGRSSQRGRLKLRRKIFRPSASSISEIVPTGQSHEQKAFLSSRL